MSNFMVSLWESIFTPGPTPTLLIATNATFGCLQLLLLILLIVTQSIHFIVLSFLCAGLWYAINWFAAEVAAAKAEEDKKRATEGKEGEGGKEKEEKERRRAEKSMSPEAGAGSDTETEEALGTGREGMGGGRLRKAPPMGISEVKVQEGTDGAKDLLRPEVPGSTSPGMADSGTLPRRRSLGDSSGYVSTDSEWEKVDDDEARK
jgi:hypothetical protein